MVAAAPDGMLQRVRHRSMMLASGRYAMLHFRINEIRFLIP
jgi:hypothetical protein